MTTLYAFLGFGISCLAIVQASYGPLFQPKGCDRNTWKRYNGCSRDDWAYQVDRCNLLKSLLIRQSTREELTSQRPETTDSSEQTELFGGELDDWMDEWPTSVIDTDEEEVIEEAGEEAEEGEEEGVGDGPPGACIAEDELLDSEQVEAMIDRLLVELGQDGNVEDETQTKRRKKRKVMKDFKINRWGKTIPYMIDGDFSQYYADMIKEAIAHWQKGTCLRFVERNVTEEPTESTILFALSLLNNVCYSYVGRTISQIPQPIHLSPLCFTLGVLAHEIAHTLGSIHEHQRPDRDQYVSIRKSSIVDSAIDHFAPMSGKYVETRNMPYDYGSALHYRMDAFSKNGRNTIETKDSRFQRSMGQRVGLSFWDYRVINEVYCMDECTGITVPLCQNRGYQNPKDCHKCLCPDGWGGDLCNKVAGYTGAPCGGELTAESTPKYVTSPNYFAHKNIRFYSTKQECNWAIRAPEGHRVVMTFEDDFGIYCFNRRCLHWLEIRSTADLGIPGPRYCCTYKPKDQIVSETNEAMLIFRALDTHSNSGQRRGFQVKYVADGDECRSNPCQNGGTCLDRIASFKCVCQPWYSGDRCEVYTKKTHRADEVDLVFVIDSTTKAGKDFVAIQTYIKSVLNHFTYRETSCRVGLISFDNFAYSRAYLNSHMTRSSLYQAIDDIPMQKGSSNYYTALWLLYSGTFMDKRGDRPGVPNVAVMITDNAPSANVRSKLSNPMLTAANSIRKSGTQLIAVTIGDSVPMPLLENIVGAPSLTVHVDDYDDLNQMDMVQHLVYRIQERTNFASGSIAMDKMSTSSTTSTTTTLPTTTTTIPTTTTTATTTTKQPTTPSTPSPLPSTTLSSTTTQTPVPSTLPSTSQPSTSTTTKVTPPPITSRPSTSRAPPRGSPPAPAHIIPNTSSSSTLASTTPKDECQWIRGSCSKDCGGCGYRRVSRECPLPNGQTRTVLRLIEHCNPQPCETDCWVYIADYYRKKCREPCCAGYSLSLAENTCVPNGQN